MGKYITVFLLLYPFMALNAQDLNFNKPKYIFLTTTAAPTLSSLALSEKTTATSESTTKKKSKRETDLKSFIEYNVDNIVEDIARGEGEYLDSIAEIAELDDSLKSCFFAKLKANFDLIFPDTNTDLNHIYIMIKGYAVSAKKHCSKG